MAEILISSIIAICVLSFIYIIISYLEKDDEEIIFIDQNKNIYILYQNPALVDMDELLNDISYKYDIKYIKIDELEKI